MGSPLRPSGRLGRADAGADLASVRALRYLQITEKLEIEPEPRFVAEISRETKRRVGGDAALPVQDVRDAAGGNAQIQSQSISAQPARIQLLLQNLTGM